VSRSEDRKTMTEFDLILTAWLGRFSLGRAGFIA
jgi:hypothetical protein